MIYQSSGCFRIITDAESLTTPKCGKCNGWLAQIDQTPDPISYVDGLGFGERIKQTDSTGPISPSGQTYQKPDVRTEARKEKRISTEIPWYLQRTQSPAIRSFRPADGSPPGH